MVGADDRIYALGGVAGGMALNTVEAYTPSTNTWETVASMPTARAVLTVAASADRRHIYAIGGGIGGGTTSPVVEEYTP